MKRSQMRPPSGVYFTAFDSKFSRIWLRCVSSPMRRSWRTERISAQNVCPLSRAMGAMMDSTAARESPKSNSAKVSDALPLSIFEMSSTSLMRSSRWRPEAMILPAQSRTLAGLSASFSMMVVKPSTAFMGVRMSWDMLARKADFDSLATSAARSAWASCSACSARSSSRARRARACLRRLKP